MENYQFAFEKLEVWQLARQLTKEIYELTKLFPDTEKFGVTNQIRRSITSVAANLAEGSTRSSYKDKAHFTTISYGSLIETLNHLLISFDLGYLNEKMLLKIRKDIHQLSIKLSNYRNYQLSKTS